MYFHFESFSFKDSNKSLNLTISHVRAGVYMTTSSLRDIVLRENQKTVISFLIIIT